MGRLFLVHPDGKTYECKFCDAKLGHVGSLLSKIRKRNSRRNKSKKLSSSEDDS